MRRRGTPGTGLALKPQLAGLVVVLALPVLLVVASWPTLFPPSFLPPPPLSPLCSHQARLDGRSHGPVSKTDLLASLRHLVGLGFVCFDLDLSPRGAGLSAAVAHPVALAAALAADPSQELADVDALCGFLAAHPQVVLVTLELKAPLGEDATLVGALAASARRSGVLARIAVAGVSHAAARAADLRRAATMRDQAASAAGRCDAADLDTGANEPDGGAVAVAMPSLECWRDAAVHERLQRWARSQASRRVLVWVVDDAAAARGLLAEAAEAPWLALVTNAPALLAGLVRGG